MMGYCRVGCIPRYIARRDNKDPIYILLFTCKHLYLHVNIFICSKSGGMGTAVSGSCCIEARMSQISTKNWKLLPDSVQRQRYHVMILCILSYTF